MKWNFLKLSTVKYETNSYEINDSFKNISIVTNTAAIELLPSENGKTSIVCREEAKAKHSVTLKNGTLTVTLKDTRKWYDHIGIEFIDARKITIYLPDGEYGALAVKGTTGGAKIASDFAFESIAVSFTTGSIKSYSSASGAVKLKTTTGGISIENCYVGSVDVSVSTGSLNAEDLACKSFTANGSTGDIKLKNVIAEEKLSLKGSTGSIKLDSCDASEIFIKTGTGSVTGTLISNKTFIARSNTGAVSIPKDTVGGKCEITTNTGNIKITLK
jgi:DUF4097 and DUF4098 domain-containing protein YvlB